MDWRRLTPSHRRVMRRQDRTCRRLIDPLARKAREADHPWVAYQAAMEAGSALLDDMAWMPDGGAIYGQWMKLSDLFDHPRSAHTPDSAQDVLRRAAQDWLDAPPRPGALKRWTERTDYLDGATSERPRE